MGNVREGIASSQTKKAAQKRGSDRLSATLRFDGPVEAVSQVSPQRARALAVRGIEVVRDLLDRFPRRYLDMSQVVTIAQATIGLSCTLVARIYETKVKKPRRNLNILEITLLDSTGTLIVTCFNQPWLADKLHKDDLVSVSGTIEFNYGFKRMTNPILTHLEEAGEAHGIIQAFHGSINKLSPSIVKRMIAHALEEVRGLYDPLPLSLRERYRLCSRYQAYRAIHFPESIEEVDMARRRLLYEELFFLELQLITEQREHAERFPGFEQGANEALVNELAQVLPFELTSEPGVRSRRDLGGHGCPQGDGPLALRRCGYGQDDRGILCAGLRGTQRSSGGNGRSYRDLGETVCAFARSTPRPSGHIMAPFHVNDLNR